MLNIGVFGYTASAIAYLILAFLLVISSRGNWQGRVLFVASSICIIWSVFASYLASINNLESSIFDSIELIKQGLWLLFLLLLLSSSSFKGKPKILLLIIGFVILLVITVFSLLIAPSNVSWIYSPTILNFHSLTYLKISVVVLALVLIEQLYRNSRPERKWAIKFIFLGIGGTLVFDFYLYSDALLFNRIDPDIWSARGYVNVLAVPFIGISVIRNKDWSKDLFFSRNLVFQSVAVTGIGLYLLLMAAGGYYIRIYGGDWSGVAQLAFLFGAALVLFVLMFSGQMRAKIRVFIGKHFHHYKYDYREEWLRVIRLLSTKQHKQELQENSIRVFSDIVESPAAGLWVVGNNDAYELIASWNLDNYEGYVVPNNSSLMKFLKQWQWVIDLDEYSEKSDIYHDLELCDWLEGNKEIWLIVPLMLQTNLYGFVLLKHSRAHMVIGWEERDLLLTVGRQIASYLALIDIDEALAEAQQFEAYNRLSAYVVHDLKNLVAQLSLVVSNAGKHKGNPQFMEDAIETVENATVKMVRLLSQLRKGHIEQHNSHRFSLEELLQEVIANRQNENPKPVFKNEHGSISVLLDRDRLEAVLEHLVQNAQEATPDNGSVEVKLKSAESKAIIEIKDSGSGMDKSFISERLFKPFDTTKGNAGMGIGVYESREFVNSLGGQLVWIVNQGEGLFLIWCCQ